MANTSHFFKSFFIVVLLLGLQPVTATFAGESQGLSWRTFFQKWFAAQDPGRGQNGGGRDPDLGCLVTPGDHQRLWNNRPRLVWRGRYQVVGIRKRNSQQLLAKQTASNQASVKQIEYSGEPLSAGKYDWMFFHSENNANPKLWFYFEIMQEQERAPISSDLQKLEAQLKSQNATPEAIALQRADYFAQRQLWADALQEAYAVESPSEALKQVTDQILNKICSPIVQTAAPSSKERGLNHL